ncbi:MAG TPA: hypothetical protein VNK73_21345 [Actinomycetota bacterium]|jgi:hypothetical protein|nr:hypothetical protein [Actinomycetota bacterium]
MSFVDTELIAVWRGYDLGVVTREEVYQRLAELERLLWRQVFSRLDGIAPAQLEGAAGS